MSGGDSKIFHHNTGETIENNRPLSVSFSRERDEINFKSDVDGDISNEDDIQISLAPYIQVYLAHSSKRVECCGISLPVPFERAARRSWWDPRFDSEILEGQYRLSAFPQIRLRFRYSLIYIFMVSLSWCLYLICKSLLGTMDDEVYRVGITFGVFSIFTLFILLFTQSNLYRSFHLPVSIMTSIVMFALSLVSVGTISVLTPVGDFSLCIEILMIMYTVIPLPLYVCIILGVSYSVLFEFFIGSAFALTPRILCHICVHLIGVHILVMTNVRMRGTFMKVGQSLLVRRQLEMEKQLKEKMIHSVMPPKVADWLMSEGANNGREGEDGKKTSLQNEGDIKSLFRPFNMHRMEDVSILFADIVGFTKMSSTKTAEQLVSILNDLFERFDDLCAANGCEKISTLGDCYYCVSGCPEPRPDHAVCCVEMGLGMIRAIAEFDRESNEGVNMRVGIHTGTVLCGIVGTRRVKFDVWSNDVTLANRMESTGKPGQVHLSENTRKFLGEDYVLEEGEVIQGIGTYFVKDRPSTFSSNQSTLALPVIELSPSPSLQNNRRSSISLATAISIHINQTAVIEEVLNNSRTPPPRTPSPDNDFDEQENLSSPIFHDRNRLSPHPEMIRSNSNPISPMHLTPRSRSPVHRILKLSEEGWKAASLPSILDTENGDLTEANPVEDNNVLSRRSLAVPAVFNNKPASPKWKYLKLNTEEAKSEAGVEEVGNSVQCQSEPQSPVSEKNELCQLEMPREDETSVCLSVNSRKDSGIRSNSRRSSIQHQLFVMNGLTQSEQHRVSGYYTSSQSSINNEDTVKGSKLPPPPPPDHFGVSFQKLRKQSDLQLIKCVQDNSASQRSYFVKPPLSGFSLFFRQKELEREYRQKAHRAQEDGASTLAAARFNTYLDIAVALLVFILLMVSSLLMYNLSYVWLLVFIILCLLQVLTLVLCLRSMFFSQLESHLVRFSSWYPWHLIGGVLVSLPVVGVLINFCDSLSVQDGMYHFAVLLFIGLIHFCNFTQLNCWMKSTFASVTGLIYLVLISSQLPYDINILQSVDQMNSSDFKTNDTVPFNVTSEWMNVLNLSETNADFDSKHSSKIVPELPFVPNQSHIVLKREIEHTDIFFNIGTLNFSVRSIDSDNADGRMNKGFYTEIYLDVLLLLLLVWFLNREFEISYRLSFHGNAVAARDKAKVQAMKDQADWLLHNIIPRHVAEHLKNTAKYSENVKNAGIIFASIINFSEMYDESYLGGKECLRVLNELVSDFDELLSRPQFASVEKIKTIGSTFMAASGLNPSMRNRPDSDQHLFDLMEFAMALQDVVEAFNRDLLEFNLILRIGYNYGDVTAGVIGTTKLYYDIWGDAVNISSRMDSTGVPGRIQVPANCLHILSQRYEFEPRGQVYVKGKDHMNVYLVIGRKINT